MKEMAKEEIKKDYNTVNQKIAERLRRFNSQIKEKPRTGEKKEKKVNNEEGD
jgi:hypothetical protein